MCSYLLHILCGELIVFVTVFFQYCSRKQVFASLKTCKTDHIKESKALTVPFYQNNSKITWGMAIRISSACSPGWDCAPEVARAHRCSSWLLCACVATWREDTNETARWFHACDSFLVLLSYFKKLDTSWQAWQSPIWLNPPSFIFPLGSDRKCTHICLNTNITLL